MSANRLTARQRAFVREYPKTHNGTQAAIAAGYSERSARQSAVALLKTPHIRALIADAERKALADAEVDHAWVIQRAKQIALENKPDRVPALGVLAKALGMAGGQDGDHARASSQHLHLHNVSDAALFTMLERLGPPPPTPQG